MTGSGGDLFVSNEGSLACSEGLREQVFKSEIANWQNPSTLVLNPLLNIVVNYPILAF